jgi:rhodanese-related sulfurtransferase
MRAIYIVIVLMLFAVRVQAQYKNDNVLFKTIDPGALYKTLKNTKDYVLLDVRSKGEFEDTSQYSSLNLGHLKGAKNISVNELGQRLNEIKADKDKPVFVYCSHSQRSRRACKMLADSGFTNITNINGGLTSLHYFGEVNKNYFAELYETKNKYSFISPTELCDKLTKTPGNIFLLDVRTDSLFKHIGTQVKDNALGTIKGSVNIPVKELQQNLATIPKNKAVIVIDLYGDDAAKAANLLAENGYKNVQVLIEGMDRWLSMSNTDAPCRSTLYQTDEKFSVVSAVDFGKMQHKENITILDVRTTDEFNNADKNSWRNIGKLKNAINVPSNEIESSLSKIPGEKNKPIIIYSFGGGAESFSAAKYLSSQGFTKVTVLYDGIFNLRWTAANIKDQPYLKDLVTNIPDINK